jgi:hypothetical protein
MLSLIFRSRYASDDDIDVPQSVAQQGDPDGERDEDSSREDELQGKQQDGPASLYTA